MSPYFLKFIVCTFAMIGFLATIIAVYKKAVYAPHNSENKNFLKVETLMKLAPTKTLYVINAGEERFLIAGDSANTTMLAKLEDNNRG